MNPWLLWSAVSTTARQVFFQQYSRSRGSLTVYQDVYSAPDPYISSFDFGDVIKTGLPLAFSSLVYTLAHSRNVALDMGLKCPGCPSSPYAPLSPTLVL